MVGLTREQEDWHPTRDFEAVPFLFGTHLLTHSHVSKNAPITYDGVAADLLAAEFESLAAVLTRICARQMVSSPFVLALYLRC